MYACDICDFQSKDMKEFKKHTDDKHSCMKCNKFKGKKLVLYCKTCKMITHIDCLKLDVGKERADYYKTHRNRVLEIKHEKPIS